MGDRCKVKMHGVVGKQSDTIKFVSSKVCLRVKTVSDLKDWQKSDHFVVAMKPVKAGGAKGVTDAHFSLRTHTGT